MDVNVLWLGAIEKQQAGKTGETKYFGEFSRNHNRSKGIEK